MATTTSTRTSPNPPNLPGTPAPGRPDAGWRRCVAWWRAEHGSVAAEVAIVAPFLVLLLVLVAVVIHRGVDTRIRLDDAAHQAARAASLQRTAAAATTAAESTAASTLSSAGVACDALSVTASTDGLRPGGAIRVTVSCDVDFGDALMPGMPGGTRMSADAVEPIDLWRSTSSTGSTA